MIALDRRSSRHARPDREQGRISSARRRETASEAARSAATQPGAGRLPFQLGQPRVMQQRRRLDLDSCSIIVRKWRWAEVIARVHGEQEAVGHRNTMASLAKSARCSDSARRGRSARRQHGDPTFKVRDRQNASGRNPLRAIIMARRLGRPSDHRPAAAVRNRDRCAAEPRRDPPTA